MKKSRILIVAYGIWILLAICFLLYLHSMDAERLFILGLIGFLTMIKLLEPFSDEPRFNKLIFGLAYIGILAFGVIFIVRVVNIFLSYGPS